jgi:polyribonucleotide nucleotidyltransferase
VKKKHFLSHFANSKVLTSRLVDGSLRPLAPHGFHDEISIACTLL